MNALEAVKVNHAYGTGVARTPALKDFCLTLAPGSFTALMGPSGSGKSTFLHLAAGLLAPDSGTIRVGDVEVTALGDAAAAKFRRRHLGVVFQAFNLIDSLTVEENVVLPVRLDRGRADAERLASLLAKLGLEGKGAVRPAELSGGERQRVAIARALYARPDVILADEPTGNLDVASSEAICALLRGLNRTERSAILLVTHDPVVAAHATRACFLRNGAIVAEADTQGDPARVARLYLETCR